MSINFLFGIFIIIVVCIIIIMFVILKKIDTNNKTIDMLKEEMIEIKTTQFSFINTLIPVKKLLIETINNYNFIINRNNKAINKFNEFSIDYEKDYNNLLEIIDKQNEIFKNAIASFNRTNDSVVNLCKISQKLIEKCKVDKIANNSSNLNLNDKQIICTIDKIKVVNKSKSASK